MLVFVYVCFIYISRFSINRASVTFNLFFKISGFELRVPNYKSRIRNTKLAVWRYFIHLWMTVTRYLYQYLDVALVIILALLFHARKLYKLEGYISGLENDIIIGEREFSFKINSLFELQNHLKQRISSFEYRLLLV